MNSLLSSTCSFVLDAVSCSGKIAQHYVDFLRCFVNRAIAPKPPEVSVLGPLEKLENDFERYLTQERGFATASDTGHLPIFRQFLREHCTGGCGSLSNLTATAINKFVERHVNDNGPRSAQIMCSILRSFLRYLRYRGEISCDLASAVPTVRRWKLSSLPKYLDPRDIKRVLATCDRHTALGRRDYAILVVLARMGLRANEVRFLTLDDIDWESGQLTVRGKGRRDVVLPLPKEVGAAIAEDLRHGRPRSDSRRRFLSYSAPHDGFSNSCTVTRVAAEALKRAGVDGVAHKGAHLFRHSLATQMLRAGASLTEIGQVSATATRIQHASMQRLIFDLSASLHSPGREVCDEQPTIGSSKYLSVRRGLGYKFCTHEKLLKSFVRFMDKRDAHLITNKLALEWAP